jgi:hypothetical protein
VLSYRMARRSFLRACGGSAALLVPLLRDIEARADGAGAPLRFLVIHKPLGAQWALWRPAATATTTAFTLPACSAPFEPLRSKMALIDGLNVACATVAGGSAGTNTSEAGVVELMTGQPTLGKIGQQDWCAGGASIDQILLARSPRLGGPASPTRTTFGSLQLAADIRADRDEIAPRVLSYLDALPNQPDIAKARQPLYPETQPLAVFNRLFGGALPPGTTAADAARLLAQKLSVLDFMRGDLARLRTLIPASEKDRLAAHADAIQKLEATIRASLPVDSTLPGGSCVVPAVPPTFTPVAPPPGPNPTIGTTLPGLDYYTPNEPDNHPHQAVGRLHLALVKAAFACDLTRVATFSWASGTSSVVFPGPFDGAPLPGGLASAPHHGISHSPDPLVKDWLAKVDTFYARETARALQEFDAQRDADGNTLLDNTVAAYVSEGDALTHDQTNVPFAVFGGKNTRIVGGQFIKATGGSLGSTPDNTTTGNRPTNDVWLALAPIFGVELDGLGAAPQFTAPLPGLVG